MSRWPLGERTVDFLVQRGRLEAISVTDAAAAAATALDCAVLRLLFVA